jgi:hypothetical protein
MFSGLELPAGSSVQKDTQVYIACVTTRLKKFRPAREHRLEPMLLAPFEILLDRVTGG